MAVKGKCEISRQQLLFDNVVCHRFIPKEQGGTDEYKNLRIIHKDVAQLIYETDVNTIYKLIEKTGCRESTKLAKLNKWRKKCWARAYQSNNAKTVFEITALTIKELFPWNAVCNESCLHGVARGERRESV